MRRRKDVLVIDDELFVLDLYQRLLPLADCSFDLVESGREALRLLESGRRYTVAIVDFVMPDMDGTQTARKLLEIDPGMKIVFATGSLEIESLKALEFTDDLITKPFTPRALLDVLARIQQRRRMAA